MAADYHRHDITDSALALIEPYTIGNKGTWGGNAKDTRAFINGVFWILRTGAPWRDLPPDYGKWNTVQRRFCRWRDKGIWEKMLEGIIQEPDFEWLMINASHIKVHPHASGAEGGNQDMERTKGGSTQKSPFKIFCKHRRICDRINTGGANHAKGKGKQTNGRETESDRRADIAVRYQKRQGHRGST